MRDETAFDKIIKVLSKPIRHITPVEWAESNRVLTKDITPFPGPMSYLKTPYLKDIVNSFMPDDPCQIITFMKGSQIGASIGGIYSLIGWVIAENPANMLLMLHDDDGIKKAMQGPVDQMINDSGLAEKIKASSVRKGRNQKTGDTSTGKQFPGGNLYTWSGQAIRKLSQISVQYIFADEIERYKSSDKKAGSVIALIESRAKAFLDTRKIFYNSTPEIKNGSIIEEQFLKGDQRRYHLPCKCCGEMIQLVWNKSVDHLEGKVGVLFDRDKKGNLVDDSVRYRCQKCGGEFKESHKYDMLEKDLCEWIPTAKPASVIYKSFHLSALFAPIGMYDWTEYARQWCEINPIGGRVDFEMLKTFINQVLGETWEEQAKEVTSRKLNKNKRNYQVCTVPTEMIREDGNIGVGMITCAVDLNGKMGESVEEDDVRLDYTVKVWTLNGDDVYVPSYSIDHGSIGNFERTRDKERRHRKGDKREYEKWTYRFGYEKSVWDEFNKTVLNREYLDDEGNIHRINICGVDTGNFTSFANTYVKTDARLIAIKGKSDSRMTKIDEKSYYRKGTQNGLYIVDGDRLKNLFSDKIDLTWDGEVDQPFGYLNFPTDESDDKYTYTSFFIEFEGEKKEIELDLSNKVTGYRWVKKHSSSRNHFWDCEIYNEAVRMIAAEVLCKGAGSKIPVTWENACKLLRV